MERLMSSERLDAASSHSRRWKNHTTQENRRGGLNPHLWQVYFHKWIHSQDDDPDSQWTEPCDIGIVKLTFLCCIWWTRLAILALWRVRQEGCSKLVASLGFLAEFEACPDYIVSCRPAWVTNECPISKKKISSQQLRTCTRDYIVAHKLWLLSSTFSNQLGPWSKMCYGGGNVNQIIPH